MAHPIIPQVIDNYLHLQAEVARTPPIAVGSSFWFHWLTDITNRSFSFKGQTGTFTARHERQRNTWYWYAYHKKQGRMHKAYLGKPEELTATRLHTIATTLTAAKPDDETDVPVAHTDDRITALQAQLAQFTPDSDIFNIIEHDHNMKDFVVKAVLLRSLILQTSNESLQTLSLLVQLLSPSDDMVKRCTENKDMLKKLSEQLSTLTQHTDEQIEENPQTATKTITGNPKAISSANTGAYADCFTRRECEVLELLKQGATNRLIAASLVISEGTVKKHVANICSKLNAKTRAQAIAIIFSQQQ